MINDKSGGGEDRHPKLDKTDHKLRSQIEAIFGPKKI